MDDVARECLAAAVDTSASGKRVVRELAQLVVVHGKPTTIISGNREAIPGGMSAKLTGAPS